MPLEAVIFDMDGVLADTVEYHYQSWQQVMDVYGIPFSRTDNEKLLGLTRRRSLEVILGKRRLPEATILEILRQKNEVYLHLLQNMTPAARLPGVTELLEELRQARVPIAVASASGNTAVVLKRLEIEHYIQVVVDARQVKQSKPAPDCYLQAAARLGISPAGCVAIEDSQAGVQAALAAGMRVAGVGPAERLHGAMRNFSSLAAVRLEALRELFVNPGDYSTSSKASGLFSAGEAVD